MRELKEECCVEGTVVRQTSHVNPSHVNYDGDAGAETFSFLVDVGSQQPRLGHDPDVPETNQVLVEVAWLTLSDISERNRVFLWAAGLLGIAEFFAEVERWGDEKSYPSGVSVSEQ